MGKLLVRIPIDPFLSRAIIEGMIFNRIIQDEKYKELLEHFDLK
jgi:hypothetical protein